MLGLLFRAGFQRCDSLNLYSPLFCRLPGVFAASQVAVRIHQPLSVVALCARKGLKNSERAVADRAVHSTGIVEPIDTRPVRACGFPFFIEL